MSHAETNSTAGLYGTCYICLAAKWEKRSLTSIEEWRDGNTANQVFQKKALSGDEYGHKCSQWIVEGQIAHLKHESTCVKEVYFYQKVEIFLNFVHLDIGN